MHASLYVAFLRLRTYISLAFVRCVGKVSDEKDIVGSRCRRESSRFSSLARLCWSTLRTRRQSVSAYLSRTRRLSILVWLCRCSGWRADAALLLDNSTLLGRLCMARAPRAHLRLITSRLFGCLDRPSR